MATIKQMRLKMEEKKKISPNDKEKIKWAVLESATRNTSLTPSELAEALCQAIIFIDSYGN
jgi:hypothetical protein